MTSKVLHDGWSKEKHLKIGTEIYNAVEYGKILWTCGFIKTSISSALFVIGFTLIFNGLTNHPLFSSWSESAIFFGIIAVLSALIVIYLIDKKREIMKKEEFGREYEIIEDRIKQSRIKQNEELETLINQIAEERIQEAIYKHLLEMNTIPDEADLTDWRKDLYD